MKILAFSACLVLPAHAAAQTAPGSDVPDHGTFLPYKFAKRIGTKTWPSELDASEQVVLTSDFLFRSRDRSSAEGHLHRLGVA